MQGFNMGRYRPPTADPRREPFNATHPLGARARRLASHGILIVRFELPFAIICTCCSHHLAQGTRFNAEKQQAGEYLTTKIWQFGLKCTSCGGRIVVRTDPKNAQYVVDAGATRKAEQWSPEDNGGFPIYDSDKARADEEVADPFARVEKTVRDQSKAQERQRRLQQLYDAQQWRGQHPADVNARLRSQFRTEKRKRSQQLEKDVELKRRIGWTDEMRLVPDASPASAETERAQWRQARSTRARDGASCAMKNGTGKHAGPAPPAARATHPAQKLRASLVAATLRKRDPFLNEMDKATTSAPEQAGKHTLVRPRTGSTCSKHA